MGVIAHLGELPNQKFGDHSTERSRAAFPATTSQIPPLAPAQSGAQARSWRGHPGLLHPEFLSVQVSLLSPLLQRIDWEMR